MKISRRAVLHASAAATAIAPLARAVPALPGSLASRVYARLAFGARPGEFEAFTSSAGTDAARLEVWLETQLASGTGSDHLADAALSEAGLTTQTKSLTQLWAEHWLPATAKTGGTDAGVTSDAGADAGVMMAAPADPRRPRDDNERRVQPMREVELATWLRAVYSTRQLHEVLVNFWHDHFSVFGREGQIASLFTHYDRDVIRPNVLGNFRVLLEAVAKSPVMLWYLDNFTSQSGNANENYARELFELHTLGAPHYLGTRPRETVAPGSGYVDGDVYEAARCFTGWRVDQSTGDFQYWEPWHDRFQKIVLGKRLPEYQPPQQDARDVLDLVAFHPGTARFISSKLCTRLLGTAPAGLIEKAARVFTSAHQAADQLAQVVKVIVRAEEFRNNPRVAVRRPFDATVAMLRATAANFYPTEGFLEQYARAGQRLFSWRTPDGFPTSAERWAGSTPMLERFRLSNQLCANALDGVKVDLVSQSGGARSPRDLASLWALRATGARAPECEAAMCELLAAGRNVDAPLPEAFVKERLPAAVALAFMAQEFQWR